MSCFFFFSSRRRHTRFDCDWSSDVCSSDLVLRQRGLTPTLTLAGGGKARAQQAAQRLSAELGLQDQVQFIGMCNDVPGLLRAHRVCVLSTHYEGMPLSLLEGMAAGCVVVGSRVVGVQE